MFEDYCTRCGECCSRKPLVQVTWRDVFRWSVTGRLDILKSSVKENGIRQFPLKNNGECSYLSWDEQGAVCSIYETRPVICRKYPVSLDGKHAFRTPSCRI